MNSRGHSSENRQIIRIFEIYECFENISLNVLTPMWIYLSFNLQMIKYECHSICLLTITYSMFREK
jgi:hypothetical protein